MERVLRWFLLGLAVLFSACTAPLMTPQQIDEKAIAPSAESNLFSPPKDGFARLIMYREDKLAGSAVAHNVFVKYDYAVDKDIKQADLNALELDRALCRMGNGSSCVVNVRAGAPVSLVYENETTTSWCDWWLFGTAWMKVAARGEKGIVGVFTPKNQHIYCIEMTSRWNRFRHFREGETCLEDYKEIYEPEHRKEQKEWLEGLFADGDKRAYEE